MRFAIVLSSISAVLIAIISATAIMLLSWIYPTASSYERLPNTKPMSVEVEAMSL